MKEYKLFTTMLDLKQINKTWTLFLDRDGVINHEKYQDYVTITMSLFFMMAYRKH
jgi:histidinol phosphatase-like enzyme